MRRFDKVVHSIERKGENPFIRVFGDCFLNLFEERRIEQEIHTFLLVRHNFIIYLIYT